MDDDPPNPSIMDPVASEVHEDKQNVPPPDKKRLGTLSSAAIENKPDSTTSKKPSANAKSDLAKSDLALAKSDIVSPPSQNSAHDLRKGIDYSRHSIPISPKKILDVIENCHQECPSYIYMWTKTEYGDRFGTGYDNFSDWPGPLKRTFDPLLVGLQGAGFKTPFSILSEYIVISRTT